MNDIITPSGFDLTKNLHGHVRVETRSRWTGKVIDSQEKDNLVTNAIAKIYKTTRLSSNLLSIWFTPIYEKALGGLLLFDNTLTESANNIQFSGSTKLVGYAGQDSDTTHAMAGSLNAAECVILSNGFTSVWDFGTSQVNGTIGSVARTSFLFSKRGIAGDVQSYSTFSNQYLGPYTLGSPIQLLGYDATNKYIYIALTAQQTYNNVTYPTNKIYKTYCDFESQSLMTKYLISDPDRWTEVATVSSSTDGTANAYAFTYDSYSDNLYYGVSGSTKKIYLISTGGARSSVSLPANATSSQRFTATENYYWYIGADAKVYQVKKSNPSDSSSVSVTDITTGSKIIGLADDCVMLSVPNSAVRPIVYSDLSVVYCELQEQPNAYDILSNFTRTNGNTTMLIGDYAGYPVAAANNTVSLFPQTGYLGTIANLDSPVTKTSSQTMKITYTLTEA